jgi:plasmid stabilization system protein ParE
VTNPKINTISRGGSRLYVSPISGDKVPGVTSVLNALPKPFLKWWAAKSVAEFAADNAGPVVSLLASGNRQAAIDLMKGSPNRDTAQAAEAGTAVHDLFERLAKGEEAGRVHPDLEPYVGIFRGFERQFSPEFIHLEQTVWSETHGYAGSFDFMARLTDPDTKETGLYIGDWKTTRSGVHAEVALQMTAYSRADYIVTPAGEKLEIPKLDGGVVVHARPEGGKVVPTRLDDELFEIFLALRRVWEYDREISKTVLGREVPIESVEEPKRRAARR